MAPGYTTLSEVRPPAFRRSTPRPRWPRAGAAVGVAVAVGVGVGVCTCVEFGGAARVCVGLGAAVPVDVLVGVVVGGGV